MPGRQRGGLVQKEQLGVVARRHQRAPSTLELEHANNPARALELTLDVLPVVMQHPRLPVSVPRAESATID